MGFCKNVKTIKLHSLLLGARHSSSLGKELSTKPLYPEILDPSPGAKAKREKNALYKKYGDLNTIEEKLFAVNLPKYYGWKSLFLKEGDYPYNILPYVEHISRTQVAKVNSSEFLKVLSISEEECQEVVEKVRSQLQEAVVFVVKGKRKEVPPKSFSSDIACQLHSVILSNLSSTHPHLLEAITDYEVRLENGWKESTGWVQYLGEPVLGLRHTSALPPLEIPLQVEPVAPGSPPPTPHLPTIRRHITNIPGFWPGDDARFSLMSWIDRCFLENRPKEFGVEEHQEAELAHLLLSAFSTAYAHASFLGFSSFRELDHPMVTQCLASDGRCFSFMAYQLNTTCLDEESNVRRNIAVATVPPPLYLQISSDNTFTAWSDEAARLLVSYYLREPSERLAKEMMVRLALIAEEADPQKRAWINQQFRHMYANRPRNRLGYEIYDWERIYKVKFEMRPMDARMRPFEREEDPLEERKYWQHVPPYVPKALRPKKRHWTGWRAKFAKTFYPQL